MRSGSTRRSCGAVEHELRGRDVERDRLARRRPGLEVVLARRPRSRSRIMPRVWSTTPRTRSFGSRCLAPRGSSRTACPESGCGRRPPSGAGDRPRRRSIGPSRSSGSEDDANTSRPCSTLTAMRRSPWPSTSRPVAPGRAQLLDTSATSFSSRRPAVIDASRPARQRRGEERHEVSSWPVAGSRGPCPAPAGRRRSPTAGRPHKVEARGREVLDLVAEVAAGVTALRNTSGSTTAEPTLR